MIERLKTDTDFRAAVFSSGTLLITLVFAVYNGFLGIRYSSLWHGSICAYYILLSLIRVFILLAKKRIVKQDNKEQRRRKVFLISGAVLLLINIAMIVPTAMMVTFEKPVNMTLIPALAMAVYTTIKVIMAVRQLKHRSESGNPLVRELWTINVVDAALSVISLQNTLIMVAGDAGDRGLFILSAISSGIIILGTIAMEVFLFVREIKR